MSAPYSSGRCSSGVANTLSTMTCAPAACARSHTAFRSTRRRLGIGRRFQQHDLGRLGERLASIGSRSRPSTNSVSTPHFGRISWHDVVARSEQGIGRDHAVAGFHQAGDARRTPRPCRWRWRARLRRLPAAPCAPRTSRRSGCRSGHRRSAAWNCRTPPGPLPRTDRRSRRSCRSPRPSRHAASGSDRHAPSGWRGPIRGGTSRL